MPHEFPHTPHHEAGLDGVVERALVLLARQAVRDHARRLWERRGVDEECEGLLTHGGKVRRVPVSMFPSFPTPAPSTPWSYTGTTTSPIPGGIMVRPASATRVTAPGRPPPTTTRDEAAEAAETALRPSSLRRTL